MVKHTEKASGVDANQPIGLGAAHGGFIQIVVVAAGAKLLERFANGCVLHRGQPQAPHRLIATCQLIHIAEDKFPLAPGVAGVDDFRNVGAVHKGIQNIKLFALIPRDLHTPWVRNDGQIIIAPLGVLFIVGVGVGKLRQMAEAPGYNITVTLHISVHALICAKDGRQAHAN